jgi:hypothetical protein
LRKDGTAIELEDIEDCGLDFWRPESRIQDIGEGYFGAIEANEASEGFQHLSTMAAR